jgi:hypothetical protein
LFKVATISLSSIKAFISAFLKSSLRRPTWRFRVSRVFETNLNIFCYKKSIISLKSRPGITFNSVW